MESIHLLSEILQRFKANGKAQVEGYNAFGYIRETENAVFVTREAGQDTRVPFDKILNGIAAYQTNPNLYQSTPTALRDYDITHVTSPVFALLHLLGEEEYKPQKNISRLIGDYANIYEQFEKLQNGIVLPKGDQKIGVIAEYYAKCYIESKYKTVAEYQKSGASFDLSYKTKSGKLVKVQVKCVSAYSKTRIIAPLNLNKNSFDELYLMALDKSFYPVAFYINTYAQIKALLATKGDKREKIVGSVMKGLSIELKEKSGTWLYDFGENKVEELRGSIKNK